MIGGREIELYLPAYSLYERLLAAGEVRRLISYNISARFARRLLSTMGLSHC